MSKYQSQAKEILDTLTLPQLVGQLFVLAYPGKDPKVIYPIIDSYGIGGSYISQDNAETFLEAQQNNTLLQERVALRHPPLPLILGVDQEGAWGVLIPESTIGPGNLALGINDTTTHTTAMYSIFAKEMKLAGYNAIFAPCSDINLDPNNPIIGTRSFGENPQRVAAHVKAAVNAVRANGILATSKHFPGHGDTHSDTHREIPVVDKPLNVLLEQELLPFQSAVDAQVDLIMTSHIKFLQLDKDNPATLSKKILTDLLRTQMKFRGLVITDSMNMGAMRKYLSPEEATIKAFMAGADLIMLSEEHYDHSKNYLDKQIASIESIIKAVTEKRIPLELIKERVYRILIKKLEIKETLYSTQSERDIKDYKKVKAQHSTQEQAAAAHAITILRNTNNLFPLDKSKSIVLINATPHKSYHNLMNIRGIGPNQAKPAFDSLAEVMQSNNPGISILSYEDIQTMDIATLDNFNVLIAVTEDYPLPGEDFEKAEQQKLIKKLIDTYNTKLIVVGLRSPYELEHYTDLKCYITSYSSRTCAAQAMGKFFHTLPPLNYPL